MYGSMLAQQGCFCLDDLLDLSNDDHFFSSSSSDSDPHHQHHYLPPLLPQTSFTSTHFINTPHDFTSNLCVPVKPHITIFIIIIIIIIIFFFIFKLSQKQEITTLDGDLCLLSQSSNIWLQQPNLNRREKLRRRTQHGCVGARTTHRRRHPSGYLKSTPLKATSSTPNSQYR